MAEILCKTCVHNSYGDKEIKGWVDCKHPKTRAKAVHWEPGDPAWVNMLTGDFSVTDTASVSALTECSCYEERPIPERTTNDTE